MSDRPVPLRQAAVALGRSAATLRRWVRQGAPVARPGSVGRAHGALVLVDSLRAWRESEGAGTAEPSISLAELEQHLCAFHRGGDHRLTGLRDHEAAALYLAFFRYVRGRLME